MSQDVTQLVLLPPGDHAALQAAVRTLESSNLAARIADYAGIPVNRVLGLLP